MRVGAISRLVKVIFISAGVALCGCASDSPAPPPVVMPPSPPSPPPPPPSPPPPPPPENFNTVEYRNQPGLNRINVIPAYEEGGLGQGTIVSIIDTGIDVNNPEFTGRIHPDSADLVAPGIVPPGELRPGGPNLQDEDDHGTPVASIIGANKNNSSIHGVAPSTSLLIFRGDTEADDETILGEAIAEGVNRSASIGADVLNLSLGSNEPAARADFQTVFDFTKANDIVSVAAAGNESGNDPEESALGALDVAGAPATIIAGAVDSSNVIAAFSNRAGVAADIFLVAPGVLIPTVRIDTPSGQTDFFSGTSAAVPHIAGAAALIRGLWPQLTAEEVVEILLDSATDLGTPGTDPIYGRGLLNVGAAVAPLGSVTTTSVNGTTTEISDISAALGPAFGASLGQIGDIVVFDRYGRDFKADLGAYIGVAAPDRFDIEATFNPFDRHLYASQPFGRRLSATFRLTSRDRALTDLDANRIAGFAGAEAQNDVIDDDLALALTGDLGAGRRLTAAQGFSPAAVDRMTEPMRQTPFLSQSAFADAYLPQSQDAFTTILRAALTPRLSADFLMTYAYGNDDAFSLTSASLASANGQTDGRRASAARAGLNWRMGDVRLRFEQGVRREDGAVLDARFSGATSATTVYGAAQADVALAPHWRLKGRYAAGYTMADTTGLGEFVDGFSNLTTTQFSAALVRDTLLSPGDSLWIGVSQPLLVETGSLRLTLPTAFDKTTETLIFSPVTASLAPAGRRFDFEAGYRLYAIDGAALDVNLLHQTFSGTGAPGLTTIVVRSGFAF